MDALKKFKEIVLSSDNIVFFGGAGVSTESKIPDFRSETGLYSTKFGKFPAETMLSRTFFDEHPHEFYQFYREKMIYPDAKPNPAHIALAKLEQQGRLKAVITQNIDGLHQKAGSKKVLELHGSVLRNHCMKCGKFYDLSIITESKDIPTCLSCGGKIKPDVTLYEEPLNDEVFIEAMDYIRNADVFIIGGTSLVVYPAASLIQYYYGDELILINKAETTFDSRADLVLRENIGEVFSSLLE